MFRRISFLALICWTLAAIAQADGLTVDQLIDLVNARLGEKIILEKIELDGVAFDPTPSVLIQLKRAGVPETAISAVIAARKKGVADSATQEDVYRRAIELAKAQKREEAAELLYRHLSRQPADTRSRAMLVLTQVKLHRLEAAEKTLSELSNYASAEPSIARHVASLAALLTRARERTSQRQELESSLRELRPAASIALIPTLGLTHLESTILLSYIDLYSADFDSAKARLEGLHTVATGNTEQIESLLGDIEKRRIEYLGLREVADWYLYSPIPCSYWEPGNPMFQAKLPDVARFSFQEYLNSVSSLLALAPLHPETLDLSFHAGLFSLPYPDLEALGDRILGARGELSIPFVSHDTYLRLVLDQLNKTISARRDTEHPMIQCFWVSGFGKLKDQSKSMIGGRKKFSSFALPFHQIQRITQHASHWGGSPGPTLEAHPAALAFEPAGLASEYALMRLFHAFYGEVAQKDATRKLGQYVVHVIGNQNLAANLIEATESSGSTAGQIALGALATAAGAAVGSLSGGDPQLLQQASETMELGIRTMIGATSKSERAHFDAAQAAWYEEIVTQTFDLDDQQFREIESLLERWTE